MFNIQNKSLIHFQEILGAVYIQVELVIHGMIHTHQTGKIKDIWVLAD